jgi:hypothetical protein
MALISGPRYPFDFFTSVAKTEFTTQDFLVESGDKKMLDQASLKKTATAMAVTAFLAAQCGVAMAQTIAAEDRSFRRCS